MTARDDRTYWNERYTREGAQLQKDASEFVVEIVSGLPGGTALDLACGRGRNAVWLAQRGYDVTAVDVSAVAVSHAREHAAEAGVTIDFQVADLTTWDPGGRSWDLVLLSYLQLPEVSRRRVHAMAATAVAPDGWLLLVAHHRDNLEHGVGGPKYEEVLYHQDDLAEDFAALDIVRNEVVVRPVDREDLQGDAIDVILVARTGS
jgi:SAM-dependent methyltransferase